MSMNLSFNTSRKIAVSPTKGKAAAPDDPADEDSQLAGKLPTDGM